MTTLREAIAAAEANRTAIGHFNISDSNQFNAVVAAARAADLPVIIGVSEGERDYIGVRTVAAMVEGAQREYTHPIYLNADHTYSVEKVREAIDAGFDSVIFDGAKLSFEENVTAAKECVAYARASGRDVLIEGELGYIGQSSKLLDAIPEGAALDESQMTTPELAKAFIAQTGADLLAPAIGNIHGMLKSGADPKLHISLVAPLREAAGVPLVLHGGSGNSDPDFLAAIAAGISVVHINTQLRLAYRDALAASLAEHPDEIAPYKFLSPAVAAMQAFVQNRLWLFARQG